jgi:TPR repeat protein
MMILQSFLTRKLTNNCMLSKGYRPQESEDSGSGTIPASGATAGPTSQNSEEDGFGQSSYVVWLRKYGELATLGKEGSFNQVKALAEEGDIEWQFVLGLFYFMGQQAPLNRVEFLNLLQRPRREGKPHDPEQAVNWFQRAATHGYSEAQNVLGHLYAVGESVPQDYIQAHLWLNLSAAQGNQEARKARNALAEKLTPQQLAEAQRLAREWKPKQAHE